MLKRVNDWFWAFVSLLGSNWITLLGATLTTISVLLIFAFVLLGVLGVADSPYVGILAFLVLPGVFLFGLVLIPVGLYWERRRAQKAGEVAPARAEAYPKIDFNKPRVRHLATVVGVLTVVNLLIISIVSYQGVVYMDTVEFCGQVCHTVMEPEHTAYMGSPHSRVKCVECHIGSGAPWFVRSKLSGVGQVFAVTLNTYPRPIPAPVENLRPSRETCEECHWPQKFTGERIRIIDNFGDDEANTPRKTVLLMHIGGGTTEGRGIHGWHMDPRRETRYIASDRQRQKIPWVQVRDIDGKISEYSSAGESADPIASGESRLMDCIDCHNRPTHIFQTPEQGMNLALARGRIDRRIPFIKKIGLETLLAADVERDSIGDIEKRIRDYYEQNYTDFYRENRGMVDEAVRQIQAIYSRNVFPEMKVEWSTYPDNIGHERFPGCFRCHDSEHSTKEDKVIEQDCETCHTILAQDESEPEILKQLGIQ